MSVKYDYPIFPQFGGALNEHLMKLWHLKLSEASQDEQDNTGRASSGMILCGL